MKPEVRPEANNKYYMYALCYVNDIICVSHNL